MQRSKVEAVFERIAIITKKIDRKCKAVAKFKRKALVGEKTIKSLFIEKYQAEQLLNALVHGKKAGRDHEEGFIGDALTLKKELEEVAVVENLKTFGLDRGDDVAAFLSRECFE